MGFWKDVAYEMSLGKSQEQAVSSTVEYYKKYKPKYFGDEQKKTESNNLL